MTDYTVHLDTDRTDDYSDTETDTLMHTLSPLHGTIGLTPDGYRTTTLTITANNTADALAVAHNDVAPHLSGNIIHASATRSDLTDRTLGIAEYLSATDAATTLGISRQRVLELVRKGTLPKATIPNTNTTLIPRHAITARLTERPKTPNPGEQRSRSPQANMEHDGKAEREPRARRN